MASLWLSHHADDELDRCTTVAGRHVCRRCAVLYPLAYTVGALAIVTGMNVGAAWVSVAVMLLPIPTVIEWCGEHVADWTYRPRRQVALTVPAAIALGLGFARYLRTPGDQWFWVMVLVWGGVCLGARSAGRTMEPSAGPGDAAQLQRIIEQAMAGDDADRESTTAGAIEQQVGAEHHV